MKIMLDITPTLFGNRVVTVVGDAEGNRVFGERPVRNLVDMVNGFVNGQPDQDLVEDLIVALEDSLRIACAYKVKEFVSE